MKNSITLSIIVLTTAFLYPDSHIRQFNQPSIQLPIIDSTKILIVQGYDHISSLKQISHHFEGKHLFIDLWATWCEPCLRDMPSSDSLQVTLEKSNIQLLYISLDKDTQDEDWKHMITSRKIYGAHIRATKALQDEITTLIWNGIDVYSIPHYIVIRKDGVVCNKNAPAPKEK